MSWSTLIPLKFDSQKWAPISSSNKGEEQQETLRIATLNVLTDKAEPALIIAMLRPKERYSKILKELQALNADIIGLNEVTTNFLRMLQDDPWIQQNYYLSDAIIENERTHYSTLSSYGYIMGNVILSKFPPSQLFHYNVRDKSLKRGVIIVIQNIKDKRLGDSDKRIEDRESMGYTTRIGYKRIGYCAAHLTSKENRFIKRKQQIEDILKVIHSKGVCDDLYIFGDLNIHHSREHAFLESNDLLDLWTITHPLEQHGFTFDAKLNSLIQMKYFTIERRRMRLDRILFTKQSSYWHPKAPMKLFAQNPIYPHKWDYLFCSDHFGLYIDLSTKKQDKSFDENAPITEVPSFGWKIFPWWIIILLLMGISLVKSYL